MLYGNLLLKDELLIFYYHVVLPDLYTTEHFNILLILYIQIQSLNTLHKILEIILYISLNLFLLYHIF